MGERLSSRASQAQPTPQFFRFNISLDEALLKGQIILPKKYEKYTGDIATILLLYLLAQKEIKTPTILARKRSCEHHMLTKASENLHNYGI